ncbi:MAG: DUF362 domain-containing protein, partial [Promethearchaeota archaeon]
KVAIKVNIGGGIDGVLSSYTDPELVKNLVIYLRDLGAKPFICEADMRGHEINSRLLDNRKYLSLCVDLKVPFVNLSRGELVSFKFLGISRRINLPLILLDPAVKIISFAPPKHHWECGITCSQKNMYGAISDYKKSRFHRYYEMIDYVVAAAARIMKPSLSIIGTRQLGAGLGPHFCIPINFNKLIIARDMIACDLYCADLLGYPSKLIKYLQINMQGQKIKHEVLPGSSRVPLKTLKRIHELSIPPKTVKLYKRTLFIQYFVPSFLQIHTYHHFEWLLTFLNHKFYVPKGDKFF